MQKILTTVQFEINTTIRFKPNDGTSSEGEGQKMPKPEVKAEVAVKRDERTRDRRRSRE